MPKAIPAVLTENPERPQTLPLKWGAPDLQTPAFEEGLRDSLQTLVGANSSRVLRLVFAGIAKENGNGAVEPRVDHAMKALFDESVQGGCPLTDISDALMLLTDRYLVQQEQQEAWLALSAEVRASAKQPLCKSQEELARGVVQEVFEYEHDPDLKNEDALVKKLCERFGEEKAAHVAEFFASAPFESDARRAAHLLLALIEGMSVCVDFSVTRQLVFVSKAGQRHGD